MIMYFAVTFTAFKVHLLEFLGRLCSNRMGSGSIHALGYLHVAGQRLGHELEPRIATAVCMYMYNSVQLLAGIVRGPAIAICS